MGVICEITYYGLQAHTALRISDIVKLKVIDVKCAIVNIKEQKTGEIKSINISNKLKIVLNKFIKDNNLKDNNQLFTSRQSKEKPMTIRRVQQIIKAIGKTVMLLKILIVIA